MSGTILELFVFLIESSMSLVSDVMLELHVPSFKKVKEFYNDLGFEIVWEKPTTKEKLGYLVMRREESILNFYAGNEDVYNHQYFSKYSKESKKGYGVEIIIPIKGIEKFYEKVNKIYPKKIVKPLNQKYNKLDFRMEDPFGYYLRFVEKYDWVNERDSKGKKIK